MDRRANNLELQSEIIEMMRQQYQMCNEYRTMIQSYSQMCSNYYSYINQHIQLIHRIIDNTSNPGSVPSRNSVFPMATVNTLTPTVNSLTPALRLFNEYAATRQSRTYPIDNERSLPLPQLHRHPIRRGTFTSLRILPTDIFSSSSREQFSASDISNTTYIPGTTTTHTVCPIGLDDFVEGESVSIIVGCGHVFKRENLERWLTRNTVCPVCRYDIVNRRQAANNRDTFEFIFDMSGNSENNNQQYQNLRRLLYSLFSDDAGMVETRVEPTTLTMRESGRSRYDAEVIVETDSEDSDEL